MKIRFSFALVAFILSPFSSFADWTKAPANWGDFQMGLVNNTRSHWDTPMRAAISDGVKFERRYTYATEVAEIMGPTAFLFTGSTNYFTAAGFYDKGVKGTMTIYMLQKGSDGLDAVKSGCADQAHMKSYFDGILYMVERGKGAQPIYVIEPDVWGYLLQNFEATMGAANTGATCHINDLGFDFLSEFSNTILDLPKAIIKTIKIHDPDAYAGILMAHWGFTPPGSWGKMVDMAPDKVLEAAQGAATFMNTLLGDTWRGDFMGVEKNGADAGWWAATYGVGSAFDVYSWDATQNANWLNWSEELAKKTDLPLLGWQICLGHPGLANTKNSYEDTFFPWFFDRPQDFMNAGFIGMMAGCNNRDEGTTASMDANTGDGGWFYDKLAGFNAGRPYVTEHLIPSSLFPESSAVPAESFLRQEGLQIYLRSQAKSIRLYNLGGKEFHIELFSTGADERRFSLEGLPRGSYYLDSGKYVGKIITRL